MVHKPGDPTVNASHSAGTVFGSLFLLQLQLASTFQVTGDVRNSLLQLLSLWSLAMVSWEAGVGIGVGMKMIKSAHSAAGLITGALVLLRATYVGGMKKTC